jgi:nucleoid DNA-binding protein
MAENKTKQTQASVSAFIDAIADEAKRADARKLVKLMQRATGEKAKMWGASIVGFGSYHYKYETGREGDMPIAGFAPRKAATVVYGVSGNPEAPGLLAKLGKHTTGKGCLYIKKLTDVDEEVLQALVEKAVAAKKR